MSGVIGDISGLLAAIYGTSSGTTTSADPLGDLKLAEKDSTKDIAKTAAEPEVARDIAAFRKAVASATDPATLLKNPTVLKVLLTASGLGDQAQYTALAQKALLSDTTNTASLADKLPNTSWKTTAQTYDFAHSGLTIIQNTSVLDTIANGYAEVLWRQSLDKNTPGLSNALAFRDQASTVTSADQILASPVLRSVVLTALGIPPQIAYQEISAEEVAITSRLDITHFKDPKFVEQFAQRYLIQNNIAGDGTTTAATSPLSAYGFATSTSTDSASTLSNTLASLSVKSRGLIV